MKEKNHEVFEDRLDFNVLLPPRGKECVKGEPEDRLIDEWPATALCSNDLMSSCLYAIGLVTVYAVRLMGPSPQSIILLMLPFLWLTPLAAAGCLPPSSFLRK